MNLGKLQDGEHEKEKTCGYGEKKIELIDNDDFFSLFIYHTNEAYSNLFE